MSGASIDIRHDMYGFSARLGLLRKERLPAAVRAMNRTMTTVRKQAAGDMAGQYPGLKIGAMKRQMRMQLATLKNAVAALTFSGKRFRLFGNFPVRGVGKFGVRFNQLPWRVETGDGDPVSPQALAQAFRQRSSATGVANIWIRTNGGERYPIGVLVAPSLAAAFVDRKIGVALTRLARERFAVVFLQEAKFRLSKRAA